VGLDFLDFGNAPVRFGSGIPLVVGSDRYPIRLLRFGRSILLLVVPAGGRSDQVVILLLLLVLLILGLGGGYWGSNRWGPGPGWGGGLGLIIVILLILYLMGYLR
jgi:hypothetical protein